MFFSVFFLLKINFKPLIIDSIRRFFSSLSFHSEIDSEASPGRLPPTACPSARTDVLGFGSLNRDLSLNDRSQYRSSIAPCDRRRRPDGQFFFFLPRPLWTLRRARNVYRIIAMYIIVICSHQKKKKRKKPYEFNGGNRYFSPGDYLTTVTPLQLSPTRHMIWSFFFPEEDYYLFFLSFFPPLCIRLGGPAPAATHVVFSATRLRRRGFSLPTKKRK